MSREGNNLFGQKDGTSHLERWAQALHLGPIQQLNLEEKDVTLRIALYERNPNSNESVRVFDSSSKKLLTELATLYGDSQAIEDLKRSNFEKEPQAPEDRLIGLYNLNLSMFRRFIMARICSPGTI